MDPLGTIRRLFREDRILAPAVVLAAVFLFSACGLRREAPHMPAPDISPEIRQILIDIEAANSAVSTLKGVGRIRYTENGKPQGARAAWVAARGGRLRIEVLGIAGQPVASLSTDGKWLYLNLPLQERYFKSRAADPSLEKLVSVPVTARETIALLTGRTPLRPFRTARLDRTADGAGLVLVDGRGRTVQKIYLDETRQRVQRFEVFSPPGRPSYRAVFEKMQRVDGFWVPKKLHLSTDRGDAVSLSIDRYWIDLPVAPSTFVLDRPGEKTDRQREGGTSYGGPS